mgnify:CR=1 FL=1|jgi:hypothetical protein
MRKKLLSNIYFPVLAILIASLFVVSCNNFEHEQEVPSFVNIKGFRMVENPNIIGSSYEGFQTSDIKDAWVYVDNEYIGTYPIGSKVPILKSGNHKIDIRPGVVLNGIALTRTEYPFYTFYSQKHDLVEGKEITIDTIDIMYKDNIVELSLMEMFEDSYISFHTDGINADTNKIVKCNNPDTVKWGSFCGAMYLNSNEPAYRIISDSLYCANKNALILEIDYWCNIPFSIGISGKPSSASQTEYINAMTVNPNQNKGWTKMYVVLGKVWQQLYQPNNFKIFFTPMKKEGVSNGWVYVDNIKIIHYPN